jgi:hypothetical protein
MMSNLTDVPAEQGIAEVQGFIKKSQEGSAATAKKEIRRPLKPRDVKFIQAKAEDPAIPDYKAAMEATGTTDVNVASTQAARMLQNVTMREALEEALIGQGFSIADSAKALIDALGAKKSYQAEGTLVESDLADHGIRMSAARTILTFLDDKSENGGGSSINFNFGTQNFVKNDGVKP